jgi:hypothetical protein
VAARDSSRVAVRSFPLHQLATAVCLSLDISIFFIVLFWYGAGTDKRGMRVWARLAGSGQTRWPKVNHKQTGSGKKVKPDLTWSCLFLSRQPNFSHLLSLKKATWHLVVRFSLLCTCWSQLTIH